MNTTEIAEIRARLSAQGLSTADLDWLERHRWSDADIPAIVSQAQHDAYVRMERALNAAIAPLTFAERGGSPEGHLAAAIGARLADWRERGEREDD